MQVLVVHADPDPDPDGFGHELFGTVVDTLRANGHQVDTLPLYELGFRAAMSADERRAYHDEEPIVEDQVREHAALVQAAEGLVFVYPSVWFGLPAMLKGWLERVLVTGVAFEFHPRTGKVRPGLRNVQRLAGITTHPTARRTVRERGDGGRRTVARTLRLIVSRRAKTTWLAMYETAAAGDAERAAFLDDARKQMGRW